MFARLPDFHYARISDAGGEKVVAIFNEETEYGGERQMFSICCEDDDYGITYPLTEDMRPVDLGTRKSYLSAPENERIHHQVLRSERGALRPLQMITVIERIKRSGQVSRESIDAAISYVKNFEYSMDDLMGGAV